VAFDTARHTFHADVIDERLSTETVLVDGLDGRYLVQGGLVLTTVAIAWLPRSLG
jgi:hypothetical protein